MEDRILELRSKGLGYKTIAQQLGISAGSVRWICKKNGVAGYTVKPEQKTEDQVKAFVHERLPSFEYAGNYTGCDSSVDIRCLNCGTVMTRSMITVRKRIVRCRVCEQNAKQKREEQQRLEKEQLRLEKETQRKKEQQDRFWRRSFNQIEMKQCPICRAFFYGSRKYCSEQCARTVANQKGKDRRLRLIKSAIVDRDITLDGLILKDGNICHICGGMCDKDDHWFTDGGVFIAGDNYPSIDHVIPLAKGGLHKWGNVKLAHRRCNYLKGAGA